MAGTYPDDRKYTQDHEWAQLDGNVVTVGITHHAQEQLGEVAFVGLPKLGTVVAAGKQFGAVESTKAVSELFSPVSGKVVAVNSPLEKSPELVNSDPHGAAWMIRIEISNPAELSGLMDAAAYAAHAGAH